MPRRHSFSQKVRYRSTPGRRLCLESLESRVMLDGEFGWAAGFGAGTGNDSGTSLSTDAAGNVYLVGSFSGYVDFDPGPGAVVLGGPSVAVVAKYSPSGGLVWARAFGNDDTVPGKIAVDGAGNAYIAGRFSSTTDFDPGPAASNLTGFGSSDVFVLKLDASGDFAWARQFGGANFDYVSDIGLDSAGNAIATGYFSGTADFDPGPGATSLTSFGSDDAFVIKLDPAGSLTWVRQFGGSDRDQGTAIAIDSAGNVYSTGIFEETVDFDPGPGAALLTSSGNYPNVFISKLDSAGSFVYARHFGGTRFVGGYAAAVDDSSNFYVTGYFYETVDFDPGAGTANLTSHGEDDAFVAKFDNAGNYVYARQFGGAVAEIGVGIEIDGSGNVFTTGRFQGTADFDPGPGVHNLTGEGNLNVFVAKLDSNGNLLFAGQFASSGSTWVADLALDPAGNIYTTGIFRETIDFDPGAATFNIAAAANSNDAFVAKLDNGGNFLLAFALGGAFGGWTLSRSAAVHGDHVYVAGTFQGTVDFDPGAGMHLLTAVTNQIFVAKFTTAGGLVWVRQFGNATSGTSVDVAFDGAGNFIVAAMFDVTADFDPGPGVALLVNTGNRDVFVAKFDQQANFVHAKSFGGSANIDFLDLAVDPQGNIYTTGYFSGSVDFDPGPGSNSLSSSNRDGFVSKLDADGNFSFARKLGNSSNEQAHAIAVDALGNAYITGYFFGTVDFDPGPGVLNLTSAGSADGFLWKLDAAGALSGAWQMGGGLDQVPFAIAVDDEGNIYTTGRFAGTTDFDPGVGVSTLTSFGSHDIFVAKFDSSSNLVFAKQLGGVSYDDGTSITVGADGAIFLGGAFQGTADLDPGPGTDNRTSSTNIDAFLVKLDGNGNLAHAAQYGGSAALYGVAADPAGNVYATGTFNETVDFDPGPGIHHLEDIGNVAAFLTKLLGPVAVVDRKVFYNNSRLDADAQASAADDAAIATDKTALLTGAIATPDNYTNYSRGLNGLMIDIASPLPISLEPGDFQFRMGNSDDPESWETAPAPVEIAVRDLGTGVQRVTLIWADGAIHNTWLEVTVRATANTGLSGDDVFYFGNQIGEVNGDGPTDAADFGLIRANPASFLNPATVDNLFDVNRDGRVNATDLATVRDHASNLSTQLHMIDLSFSFSAGSLPGEGEAAAIGAWAPRERVGDSIPSQPHIEAASATSDAEIHAQAVDRLLASYDPRQSSIAGAWERLTQRSEESRGTVSEALLDSTLD